MRRWAVVLLIAVLIGASTSACKLSKVKSDATVHISGQALDASGKPLANTKVLLIKEADIGETVLGFVFTLGSLGATCFIPDAPSICSHAKNTTTDANGNYRFTITGKDTQGTVGTESTLDVVVADPKAGKNGPATTLRFAVRENEVTLPTARLWPTKLGAARQPKGRVGATWSPLPSGTGSGASYSLQIFDSAGTASSWTAPAGGTAGFIDARILEDKPAIMAAGATTKLSGASGTGDVRASYMSVRAPLNGNAGAPPSRGRPCSSVSGTGVTPTATPQQPCKVTDGDLVTIARLTGNSASVVTGAVVDLGQARPIQLVVARGVSGSFVVEVSSDGTTFRQVALSDGQEKAISPQGAPTARYVRVRSLGGLDQSFMAELSIW